MKPTVHVTPWLQRSYDLLWTVLPLVLVAALLLGLAFMVVNPAPPKILRLATSQSGASYALIAQKYQTALATYGITVETTPSEGSLANIDKLLKHEVDAAFVQNGGLPKELGEQAQLASLGEFFRQTLWIFYRTDKLKPLGSTSSSATALQLSQLTAMKGWRINIGKEGSGSRALAIQLLERHGLRHDPSTVLSSLGVDEGVSALLNGTIDATLFVATEDAPSVDRLLKAMGDKRSALRLLDVAQADSYVLNIAHLTPTVLPQGILNFEANIPDRDIHLLATTASLVVRKDTHPALQNLLMMTGRRIHQPSTLFQSEGEFPIGKPSLYPLADEAERFYRHGNTPKGRWPAHLFWITNLIDRMWIALVTIAAAMIPISRMIPPFYAWRIRRRIYRWYGELYRIEHAIDIPATDRSSLRKQLQALEIRVGQVKVPLSRAYELYNLRSHIELVHQRLHT
ncbi:MAG: TAXI family TRAP transporter solute-binding subunit [Leptothrix ochracea]|uniref:TAXI family TRAP transporter solute-binding subunit n=1 Tax=Leptothrix ochracea TaxID=735331 RepID=UPI0034E2B3D5